MILTEKHRPATLAEVVGQPKCVAQLRYLARHPEPCCKMLEGPTGTGKTSAARAFAAELGCFKDEWFETCHTEEGANFGIDRVRYWFNSSSSPLHVRAPGGWHVLLIEELEELHPSTQTLLKKTLDGCHLPSRTIVLATTNDSSRLKDALRHRFEPRLIFDAGPAFARACYAKLAEIWRKERPDDPMPQGWATRFGWEGTQFSMRLALAQLQSQIVLREEMREEVAA